MINPTEDKKEAFLKAVWDCIQTSSGQQYSSVGLDDIWFDLYPEDGPELFRPSTTVTNSEKPLSTEGVDYDFLVKLLDEYENDFQYRPTGTLPVLVDNEEDLQFLLKAEDAKDLKERMILLWMKTNPGILHQLPNDDEHTQ